jgi:hypothetical protein
MNYFRILDIETQSQKLEKAMKKTRKMKAYTRFIERLNFFKLINTELEFVNPYLFDCKVVSIS